MASWNIEFAELFPILGLKEINDLEKLFLTKLDYQLFVSPSIYAKYYFALRSHLFCYCQVKLYCLRQVRQSNVPKLYLDLNIGVSKKIRQGPHQGSRPSPQDSQSKTMIMPNICTSCENHNYFTFINDVFDEDTFKANKIQ